MNKPILTALCALLGLAASAQVSFEPGYYINNNGTKTECLIRNPDKKANPTRFEYQLPGSTETRVAVMDTVSAFEILNTVHKYQRTKVAIERSGTDLKSLAGKGEITFNEEVLFLRVLVEGEGSLYYYYGGSGAEKYFFKVGEGKVEQLVSYSYMDDQTKLVENNSFRQQLWNHLRCPSSEVKVFNELRYKKSDLVHVVADYNECRKAAYVNYSARKKKGAYHFTLKGGLNTAALEVDQHLAIQNYGTGAPTGYSTTHTDKLGQTIAPVAGMEMEYVFPFYKNRWSTVFEPTFQYYKKTSTMRLYTISAAPSNPGVAGIGDVKTTVSYSHVSLPLGVRHYFFLKDGTKLFANGSIAYNVLLSNPAKTFHFDDYHLYLEQGQKRLNLMPSYSFSFGYKQKEKYSLEAVCHIAKTMLDNEAWTTRFVNSFSLVFGYRLK